MTGQVIEWAPFNIRAGITEQALIEASARLQQDFLALQVGFLRRELVRSDASSYVDIVWWQSMETAEAAMAKVSESAACSEYFSLMQADQAEAGAGVRHFQIVRSF